MKSAFFIAIISVSLTLAMEECVKTHIETVLLSSLESRNLTITNQPFVFQQTHILQAAVENIQYEATNVISDNQRPSKPDPSQKPYYYLIHFESIPQLSGEPKWVERKIYAFQEKKVISLINFESKIIVAFSTGLIRFFESKTLALIPAETLSFETNVKDVKGVFDLTFKEVNYLAVFGRQIGVYYFKRGVFSELYPKPQEKNPIYQSHILNIVHVKGQLIYYVDRNLYVLNLSTQQVEKTHSFGDYSNAFVFQLFSNTTFILPKSSVSGQASLFDIQNPSKAQSINLRNPIQGDVVSAISLYQGLIAVKDTFGQVYEIPFESNNVQSRNQTSLLNSSQFSEYSFDYYQSKSREVLFISQEMNQENKFSYVKNVCLHCPGDQFLKRDELSPPFCQQCGYQCASCTNEKRCTMCENTYFLKDGICSCASKFYENKQLNICERVEEGNSMMVLIILSIIAMVVVFSFIISYLKKKEEQRILKKEKIFKSKYHDQDIEELDGEENQDSDGEEIDEEKQNNVTQNFDSNKDKQTNKSNRSLSSSRSSKSHRKAVPLEELQEEEEEGDEEEAQHDDGEEDQDEDGEEIDEEDDNEEEDQDVEEDEEEEEYGDYDEEEDEDNDQD